MILLVLAYLGGVLTIVSPRILPVLPFVLARADRSFLRSGLPTLIGMAAKFATVATLAAVAGRWAVEANQYGQDTAIVLLGLFGLSLLLPGLAEALRRLRSAPLRDRPRWRDSLVLGVASSLTVRAS
jgi:cytochrome c biogenesis protein CcdA